MDYINQIYVVHELVTREAIELYHWCTTGKWYDVALKSTGILGLLGAFFAFPKTMLIKAGRCEDDSEAESYIEIAKVASLLILFVYLLIVAYAIVSLMKWISD